MPSNESKLSVIGALIHPAAPSISRELIQRFYEAFMYGVFVSSGLSLEEYEPKMPKEAVVFVEGQMDDFKLGTIRVLRMPLELLDIIISRYEHSENGGPSEDEPETAPSMFFIGSVAFCQAATHYVATQPEGLGNNWGFHLMRLITGRQQKEVVWIEGREDTKEEVKRSKADITELLSVLSPSSAA